MLSKLPEIIWIVGGDTFDSPFSRKPIFPDSIALFCKSVETLSCTGSIEALRLCTYFNKLFLHLPFLTYAASKQCTSSSNLLRKFGSPIYIYLQQCIKLHNSSAVIGQPHVAETDLSLFHSIFMFVDESEKPLFFIFRKQACFCWTYKSDLLWIKKILSMDFIISY